MTALLLLLSVEASAAELALRWDAPARYHSETLILTPPGLRFFGLANQDARALQMAVVTDSTCTPVLEGRTLDYNCVIDRIELEGVAFSGEQDKLNAIFTEYEGLLTGATVEMVLKLDGQVVTVDLEGVSKDRERWNAAQEILRQVMRRVYSPLLLQSPKGGVDPGKPWKYKGTPLFFEMITRYGTTGGTAFSFETDGRIGDDVKVIGVGKGSVANTLEFNQSGAASTYLSGTGAWRVDPQTGQVAYGEVQVLGEASASGIASVGSTLRYQLAATIARVGADGRPEVLAPAAAAPAATAPSAEPAAPPAAEPAAVPAAPAAPEPSPG
jgi:hypothetical protein